MNDEEFCQAIGYTSGFKRELAGKIRDVTASLCMLEPAAITPGEDTDKLNSKTFDGWDDVKFLMELEHILDVPLDGVRLPNFVMRRFFFLYKEAKPLNYGEWVKNTVEVLAPIVVKRFTEKRPID